MINIQIHVDMTFTCFTSRKNMITTLIFLHTSKTARVEMGPLNHQPSLLSYLEPPTLLQAQCNIAWSYSYETSGIDKACKSDNSPRHVSRRSQDPGVIQETAGRKITRMTLQLLADADISLTSLETIDRAYIVQTTTGYKIARGRVGTGHDQLDLSGMAWICEKREKMKYCSMTMI